jgi:hypothetical protein
MIKKMPAHPPLLISKLRHSTKLGINVFLKHDKSHGQDDFHQPNTSDRLGG